MSVITS